MLRLFSDGRIQFAQCDTQTLTTDSEYDRWALNEEPART
jgi:hypothetical protein